MELVVRRVLCIGKALGDIFGWLAGADNDIAMGVDSHSTGCGVLNIATDNLAIGIDAATTACIAYIGVRLHHAVESPSRIRLPKSDGHKSGCASGGDAEEASISEHTMDPCHGSFPFCVRVCPRARSAEPSHPASHQPMIASVKKAPLRASAHPSTLARPPIPQPQETGASLRRRKSTKAENPANSALAQRKRRRVPPSIRPMPITTSTRMSRRAAHADKAIAPGSMLLWPLTMDRAYRRVRWTSLPSSDLAKALQIRIAPRNPAIPNDVLWRHLPLSRCPGEYYGEQLYPSGRTYHGE